MTINITTDLNKKTTRDIDLDILSDSKKNTKTAEGKKHRQALLAKVYEMSKDKNLEKMRFEIAEQLKRGTMAMENNDMMGMAMAEIEIERLEKEVKEYVNSEQYKRNIAKIVARQSNTQEANQIIKKEI